MSDGGDNASSASFAEVLATALRMNAVIYTISIDDQYNREGNDDVLRKLASVTGGEAFFARHVEQAAGILRAHRAGHPDADTRSATRRRSRAAGIERSASPSMPRTSGA